MMFSHAYICACAVTRLKTRLTTQGCQLVYLQTKDPNFSSFRRALEWEMLVFLWSLGTVYGYLVYCMAIWYIFTI
jgi:hypothetical protein